ncbi:MobV family relaxase [uncultured Clostridium sp.]|uniref:MobV family relaxase n=1 Tax=uncultured Clostridium sp. TaxID=59620 RepID=UPI0025E7D802|nr:MobV family relaxase [uncultured Clostridium sp.]
MSYSVFRIEGVKTTSDLRGLGKHNKDRVSHTNPDIDKSKSSENIDLIKCNISYNEKFNQITSEIKLQHDERMKTMRSDRVKSFEQSINSNKSDVACEMIFTSDKEFFKDMSKDDIRSWAEESLNFVKHDIGINEKNIIHATVHMDESTPHLHVVAVPLITAYDKRRKKDILKISRAKYIPDKNAISKLQDSYNLRLREKGYDLERGLVGGKIKHIKTVDYKHNKAKELNQQLDKSIDTLNKHLKAIREGFDSIYEIEHLESKKSFLGGKMTLLKDDYEKLVNLAKKSIKDSIELKDLKNINKSLKSQNEYLSKLSNNKTNKITELQKQNNILLKNNNILKTKSSAMLTVLKKHDLVPEANKLLQDHYNKENSKNKNNRNRERNLNR